MNNATLPKQFDLHDQCRPENEYNSTPFSLESQAKTWNFCLIIVSHLNLEACFNVFKIFFPVIFNLLELLDRLFHL